MTSVERGTHSSVEIDYERPPVVEVAIAVAFAANPPLGVIQLGEIRRRLFQQQLPRIEQHPPVQMPIEQLVPAGAAQPSISFGISAGVPLPRLWFLNDPGTELAQLQTDWFARNWRKRGADDNYPRYPAIRSAFERDLTGLSDFLNEQGGALYPRQCEVTYINHVFAPSGNSIDVSDVLVFEGRSPDELPIVEARRFQVQYLIGSTDAAIGRLYVSGNKAIRRSDGKELISLTLTARGAPTKDNVVGVLEFVDRGREEIVRAFAAITREDMQSMWGKNE